MTIEVQSKADILKDSILQKLKSGEYQANQKIKSIRDLAFEFNVSKHTASQAISNLVAQGYLRQEHGKGTFFTGEVGLAVQKKQIGIQTLMRMNDYGDFIQELMRGASNKSQANGYNLLYFHQDDYAAKAKINYDDLSGLVINYNSGFYTNTELQQLSEKLCLVLVNNECPGIKCNFVAMDNERAGILATNHLLDKGHQRIGFISWPPNQSSVTDRVTGYKLALTAKGIPVDNMLLNYDLENIPEQDYMMERCVKELLEQPGISAIICVNDILACLASKHVRRLGLNVPDDIAIVGFDNFQAAMADVPLTVVEQPVYEMGQKAAEIAMTGASSDRQRHIFQPKLIEREST